MSTLPSPKMIPEDENAPVKKIYVYVDTLQEFIPRESDRYRLAYCLYNYYCGKGDSPLITVKNGKMILTGITAEALAAKIEPVVAQIISEHPRVPESMPDETE